MKKKEYRQPEYQPNARGPSDELLSWFAGRGIPAEIVKRHRIESRRAYFSSLDPPREKPCIAFPFLRNGAVVNVKYRYDYLSPEPKKTFASEKGAEVIRPG